MSRLYVVSVLSLLTLKRLAPGGTTHKEIFSFRRVEGGDNQDKEWELVVKPVIEKWGTFVEVLL